MGIELAFVFCSFPFLIVLKRFGFLKNYLFRADFRIIGCRMFLLSDNFHCYCVNFLSYFEIIN